MIEISKPKSVNKLPGNRNRKGLLDYLYAMEIYVSGGSVCNTVSYSYVLEALWVYPSRENIRVSFAEQTTIGELEILIDALSDYYNADPDVA